MWRRPKALLHNAQLWFVNGFARRLKNFAGRPTSLQRWRSTWLVLMWRNVCGRKPRKSMPRPSYARSPDADRAADFNLMLTGGHGSEPPGSWIFSPMDRQANWLDEGAVRSAR